MTQGSRLRRVTGLVLAALFVLTPPVIVGTSATASAAANTAQSCVGTPASATSPEMPPVCYPTFAAAIAAVTHGVIQLPPGQNVLLEKDYDAAMSAARAQRSTVAEVAASSTVIGYEYADINFGGASFVVAVSGSCSAGGVFSYSSMPAGWNDRIGSALTYGGCKSRHFQNTNFGGISHLCGCAWIAEMSDRTSSIRWSTSGY